MKFRKALISAAAMGAATLAAQSASAAVVIGGNVTVPTHSVVTVTYLGSGAPAAKSTSVFGLGGTPIFTNKTTPIGSSFGLGTFAGGAILDLTLLVKGKLFHSGAAGGNPDGVAHLAYDSATGIGGFEDVFGGGDKDYNDVLFALTFTPVPEAATWAMMIGGFGLVGAAMRRRRTRMSVTYA